MRNKILLTGQKDCLAFCNKANEYAAEISLKTSDGKYSVNAKSIMGCMLASAEWGDDIWVESDADLYTAFERWIDNEAEDGNYIHD